MKKIIIVTVLLLSVNFAKSQCRITITQPTQDTIICQGDSVELIAWGACDYLLCTDFNNLQMGSGWSSNAGPMFSNPCPPSCDGSVYLWIGPAVNFPRELITNPFDVSMGNCGISFDMKYADQSGSSPCEGPDLATEGVHLQYSTNGSMGPWTDINYWNPSGGHVPALVNWGHYNEAVPVAALGTTTAFRWYQTNSSSSRCDHWGLDNVNIDCPNSQNVFWSNGATSLNGGFVSPTTTTSYIVVIIDTLGNLAQDTITITVQPEPQSDFTVTTPVSFGQTSHIVYTGNCTSTAHYTWDFNGGTPATAATQGPHDISWNAQGIYNVSLIVEENGCISSPSIHQVEVGNPIYLTMEALPDSICLGDNSTIVAHASGGNGGPYNYDFGSGVNTDSTLNVNPTITTTYYITVTDNAGSPAVSDSIEVAIFDNPIIDFMGDPLSECIPFTVSFTDLSTPRCISWEWDFGDPAGGASNTSISQNPSYNYNNAGTYDVSLIATSYNGCVDTLIKNSYITAHPLPTAAFYANPSVVTSDNPEISFVNNCTNGVMYIWNFGDNGDPNNTSTDENPMHSYSGPGIFTVTQYVETAAGCADSTSRDVIVEHEFGFFVPSAFTPNGDGINDDFFPKGIGLDLDTYSIYIYDRWGEIVFNTTEWSDNEAGRWNGQLNGEDVPQGVYSYIIGFKDLLGKKYEQLGSFTLYR